MRRKIDPSPGNGAGFAEAWRFAFFGGTCSGVIIVVLSGTSAGAASTTFGGSVADGSGVAAEIEDGAEAITGAPASARPEGAAGAVGLTATTCGGTEEGSAEVGGAAVVADVDG
jgi:hypothetical protein